MIPVYDYRFNLQSQIDILEDYTEHSARIIVVENGSTRFQDKLSNCHYFHIDNPAYGQAIKLGVALAPTGKVMFMPADLAYAIDFIPDALKMLDWFDFILGSKYLKGSIENRPIIRKLNSRIYSMIRKSYLGIKVTDTSGIMAWNRSKIIPIMVKCKENGFLFSVELCLLAEKAELRIFELPVLVNDYGKSSFGVSSIPDALKHMQSLKARTK